MNKIYSKISNFFKINNNKNNIINNNNDIVYELINIYVSVKTLLTIMEDKTISNDDMIKYKANLMDKIFYLMQNDEKFNKYTEYRLIFNLLNSTKNIKNDNDRVITEMLDIYCYIKTLLTLINNDNNHDNFMIKTELTNTISHFMKNSAKFCEYPEFHFIKKLFMPFEINNK